MGARGCLRHISSCCRLHTLRSAGHVRRHVNARRLDHADDVDGDARAIARGRELCFPVDVAGHDDCDDASFLVADAGTI